MRKEPDNNFPDFENCDTLTKPYLIGKTKPYFQNSREKLKSHRLV